MLIYRTKLKSQNFTQLKYWYNIIVDEYENNFVIQQNYPTPKNEFVTPLQGARFIPVAT